MKIGVYDPYLDDIGGGEKYMMTVAECLSKENSLDIFWDNPLDLERIKERFSIDISKINLVPNIFKNTSFLRKQAVSRKYDIIIFLSDGSIPVLSAKKLFLHMQQPINIGNLSLKDRLKIRRVSKIFCNSLFTKKFIDRSFNINSTLLYPPVSIYGIGSKKENIILHVGRFRVIQVNSDDYKKQNLMISVFRDLVDRGLRGWKFLLAVSLNDLNDSKFANMKDSAKGYPIEFLINSSNEDLWKEGGKAKIYWHASGYGEDLEKHPELAEHFGISTVEAMGVGAVPVVISAGGQKEVVKDGENGFLWNNLDEFKEKTLRLIKDKELIRKFSKASYNSSLGFDKTNFCSNLKKVLNV